MPLPRLPARGRRVSGLERWLARRMLRAMGNPPVRLVLWNGEEIAASDAPPVARVLLHDRATFWKVLLDPNLQFGDAYADGRLEVEGDLVALLETIYRSRAAAGRSGSLVPSWLLGRLHRARPNTRSAARANIHHHYDLGEDFYRLWLDERDGLQRGIFRRPGNDARRGAAGEAGLRLPQALAEAGRDAWSRSAAAGGRWPCGWPATTA